MGLRLAGGFLVALLVSACAGQPTSLEVARTPVPGTGGPDMNGRWKLTAPDAPSCGMYFSGAPSANEGAIRPEGGCPETFFTSRHWAFSGSQLTIADHRQSPLARLKLSHGRFSGKSTAGTPVTLSRYPTPAS